MLRQHRVTPKYWNVKYLLLPFLFYQNSSGVVRAFLQSCLAMHNGWRGYENLIVYIYLNANIIQFLGLFVKETSLYMIWACKRNVYRLIIMRLL
jgi:hypothetical protein